VKAIWKYPLPIEDDFFLALPKGAVVLSVQIQGSQPCIWVLIEHAQGHGPTEKRHFMLYGTGHPIRHEGEWTFVGTFQLHGGSLVFHLFVEDSK
jgi:hypothetical protein